MPGRHPLVCACRDFEVFKQKLIAAFNRVKVGSPLSEESRVSCLINAQQGERVLSYITMGLEEGAELLAGAVAQSYQVVNTVTSSSQPCY